MSAPSFDDLFADFQAEAQDRRADLTFDAGDIAEMYAYGGAAMADHLAGYFARRIAATYLDGAEKDDLTTLADDHWNIQRFVPNAASGEVTFNRASAAAGAGTLPQGFIVGTAKDQLGREVQLITDEDVTYGALETGNKTVGVTAQLEGIVGNVATVGAVNRLVTVPFDATITVSNAAAIAGGTEAESDDELRERVRNFSPTIRRGTLAALEYGAKQVVGVAFATAVEGDTGVVSVYVSDSAGASNPVMTDAVEAELENWRSAGILVNVYGGTIYNITVDVTLTVRPGVNTAAIASKVKAAIVATVNKLKIGETLYPLQLRTAAKNVDPDGIVDVTIDDPAVGVVPLATQLIRTTAGSVTVA